jgi:hypothetical protein
LLEHTISSSSSFETSFNAGHIVLLQVRQEFAHLPFEGFRQNIVFAKSSFSLGRLLGQNMTMERLVTANFAFRCSSESFCRSPIALHLGHIVATSSSP